MIQVKQLTKDNLHVNVYGSRDEMGRGAAAEAAAYIREALKHKPTLNIVFAAAPSQNEFLKSLLEEDVDWTRINAFHMDEYLGLPADAPQGFGNFLDRHIFSKAPFRSVHYLKNCSGSASEVCDEYEKLLKENPVDIVFMGIGENGHIAFNDPHVADFHDNRLVKTVDLDQTCRLQQVHDGCFSKLEEVPTHALTLTIPALVSAERVFCIVPAKTKAQALKETVEGEVSEKCPASILRRHRNATIYADPDSASLLAI